MLGTIHAAEVTVINDIKPALISFTGDNIKIAQSEKKLIIPVCRLYHSEGKADVSWKIRSKHGHKSPMHDAAGHIVFEDSDELKNIEIIIPQTPVVGLDQDEWSVSLEAIDAETLSSSCKNLKKSLIF